MPLENVQSAEVRPKWTYLLLACLLFLGVGALYGGTSLILDPTGGLLGLPFERIRDTIFGDYLIPGLVLLGILGIGSFVVVYGILRRTLWAWPAGVGLGTATVVWIGVQLLVVRRYFFLQPVIAAVGVIAIVLLGLPSMRRYYRAAQSLELISL